MSAYGPLIVTEFGTFDCSSPYIRELLDYFAAHGVSYTVWALWNQNSGGPGNGACGYPSIVTPQPDVGTMFSPCIDLERCKSILEPLGWAGSLLIDDMRGVASP